MTTTTTQPGSLKRAAGTIARWAAVIATIALVSAACGIAIAALRTHPGNSIEMVPAAIHDSTEAV